jgi:hypothetical protein
MLSSDDGILDQASTNATVLTNAEIYEKLVLLHGKRIASLVIIKAIFLGISCIVFFIEMVIFGALIIRALLSTRNTLRDEPDSDEKTVQENKYNAMKNG